MGIEPGCCRGRFSELTTGTRRLAMPMGTFCSNPFFPPGSGPHMTEDRGPDFRTVFALCSSRHLHLQRSRNKWPSLLSPFKTGKPRWEPTPSSHTELTPAEGFSNAAQRTSHGRRQLLKLCVLFPLEVSERFSSLLPWLVLDSVGNMCRLGSELCNSVCCCLVSSSPL